MHEDPDRCYRAVASRDARFDGRFVTAVTSTGIYCRPSCPAQTPKRENVRFFPCAAAAVAAGFRACKRCRPEAAPGSREWDVRGDLAARALRAIAAGALDGQAAAAGGGVPALARSLHVSDRHLHRVLVAEVGAGPLALARTRRAQTARLLLDATTLSISDVAFAAGFASVRQFNDTMREHFGVAPREIRRRPAADVPGNGALTLRLGVRLPYAASTVLEWLSRHLVAGIEELDGSHYRRVLPSGAIAALRIDDTGVTLTTAVDDVRTLPDAVTRCRRLVDADADPAAVDDVLSRDKLLAPLVRARPGLRVPGATDGFELLVRTVLAQQVSLRAANTFAARLVQAYGKPLDAPVGSLTSRFPTSDVLADATLDGIGLTGSRQKTLRAVAAAHATGELVLDPSADRDETRATLLALPGIGPWTAEYVAMRALGDPDAFPGTDLVLSRRATPRRAERWRPWRAYAAMHFWNDALHPTSATPTAS
ncbi:MAG TPA: Ada metal-binding domain-containing protein [Mycobacteriales bacterium]|nr:Ada metal-binding domain-containing protein [Mycobacteriales bacterium]